MNFHLWILHNLQLCVPIECAELEAVCSSSSQFYGLPTHSWLLYTPHDRIFPNSTWLDYSVQNCFSPCLGFTFFLYSTSFSQLLYSRLLGHPVVTIPLVCFAHPRNFVTRKAMKLARFQHFIAGDLILQ